MSNVSIILVEIHTFYEFYIMTIVFDCKALSKVIKELFLSMNVIGQKVMNFLSSLLTPEF